MNSRPPASDTAEMKATLEPSGSLRKSTISPSPVIWGPGGGGCG
jgi:hypothetical protein